MNEYAELVGEIEDSERSTLALLLIEVLERLEIPIPDFQAREAHHSQTRDKARTMMAV